MARWSEPCSPCLYDEDIIYNHTSPPWMLNPETHADIAPAPGAQNFCKCIWEHIAPGPFVVDPATFELTTVWTPRADHYLSILWFHSHLHKASHGTFLRAHYHECLSILLSHRVSQHDLFARVRYLRKILPQCWIEASMANSDVPVVVEVFDELNAKWQVFMEKFDVWDGYVDEIVEDEAEEKRRVDPEKQRDRVAEMSRDVERFLEKEGDVPVYIEKWIKWWILR